MMSGSKSRLEKEKMTIKTMINMYCKKKHGTETNLCEECLGLFEYAEKRLKYCQFGEDKPTCENCPIHCYKPDMRERVRKIMRFAGPRMIYTHPIMGFRHLFNKRRKIENLN
jgi:hypothetical protein